MESMIDFTSMVSGSNSTIDAASMHQPSDLFSPSTLNLAIVLIVMAICGASVQFAKTVSITMPSPTTKKRKAPPKLAPLCDFVSYNESILYKESTVAPEKTCDAPGLIILCTWMGAAHSNIAKYTNTYATQFPSASQLIVGSTLSDMTWRTHISQRRRITPSVNILVSVLEANPDIRILLHLFSDGGANTACQLAHELRVRTNRPLPATAMILDSTPGSGTYKTCLDAIVNSMPSSLLIRSIGIPLTHVYLMTVWNLETFLRIENVRERRRLDLNDGRLFAAQAPRLYVYSKADKIIPWRGVEAHAEAATSAGFQVEWLRFDETSHVRHIQKYAAAYWDSVERLWFMRNLRV